MKSDIFLSGKCVFFSFCIFDFRGLSFLDEDVVTSQDVIYNINGQRIGNNSLQKGIYIKNGKKYIVK